MLAAITGNKPHQMEFASDRYGSVKQPKQAKGRRERMNTKRRETATMSRTTQVGPPHSATGEKPQQMDFASERYCGVNQVAEAETQRGENQGRMQNKQPATPSLRGNKLHFAGGASPSKNIDRAEKPISRETQIEQGDHLESTTFESVRISF
jgi:hypothetical protein